MGCSPVGYLEVVSQSEDELMTFEVNLLRFNEDVVGNELCVNTVEVAKLSFCSVILHERFEVTLGTSILVSQVEAQFI
jgi:hypothetical protein